MLVVAITVYFLLGLVFMGTIERTAEPRLESIIFIKRLLKISFLVKIGCYFFWPLFAFLTEGELAHERAERIIEKEKINKK